MTLPTVDPEKRSPGSRKKRGKRSFGSWLWRRVVLAIVCLAMVPAILAVVYRVPFIHPVSTLMIGNLVTLTGYERQWISLEAMGSRVQYAVMMSEDGRFCSHGGVDWGALNTVINDALSGERPRGASTITMQTAKNLFLWTGRSFIRKAIEVPLAVYLDLVLPKRRIMEIYLNIVELGPHIYGVEAAARHYFGRSASELSSRQAALLAVTLPNPAQRNPSRPSSGLNRLASVIERRAAKAGGYVDCLRQ